MKYPVNEIFCSIQGEANFTGRPSVFIRLQGCDVGCPWCDTKHTWAVESANAIPIRDMTNKTADSAAHAWMDSGEIVRAIREHAPRHVVISGGEPCLYDLRPLSRALQQGDRYVQVETSGTEEVRVADGAWVTVSPKLAMPGGRVVRLDALLRADEIKVPVGKQADVEQFLRLAAPHVVTPRIWLQPLSQNPTATALCVEQAKLRGWSVSLQTHKFMGAR